MRREMGALAAQDDYQAMPTGDPLYTTASPLVSIYPGDIDAATERALAFGGSALGTRATTGVSRMGEILAPTVAKGEALADETNPPWYRRMFKPARGN